MNDMLTRRDFISGGATTAAFGAAGVSVAAASVAVKAEGIDTTPPPPQSGMPKVAGGYPYFITRAGHTAWVYGDGTIRVFPGVK